MVLEFLTRELLLSIRRHQVFLHESKNIWLPQPHRVSEILRLKGYRSLINTSISQRTLNVVALFLSCVLQALRVGHLWYLNVHSRAPYSWVVTRAVLLPTQLVLSWPIPGQGRGIVTLDLVHCTEVLSVPSPTHPRGRDDIGSIAAKRQSNMPDYGNLNELLCPFQLIYEDRVERLAVESARERVRWVGAVWQVLR